MLPRGEAGRGSARRREHAVAARTPNAGRRSRFLKISFPGLEARLCEIRDLFSAKAPLRGRASSNNLHIDNCPRNSHDPVSTSSRSGCCGADARVRCGRRQDQQLMRVHLRSRAARAASGLAVVAVGLAACGGGGAASTAGTSTTATSSSAPANGASGPRASATRNGLVACLQRHGVTLPSGGPGGTGGFRPPRGGQAPPSGSGAGGPTGPPAGFGATGASGPGFPGGNSKFAAALRACGGGFPGRGAPPTGSTGGLNLSSGRERAAITDYARCMDAHGVKLPKPNFSGTGSVFGNGVDRSSKTFTSANRVCQRDLQPSSTTSGG
jgi:hypothetical protein